MSRPLLQVVVTHPGDAAGAAAGGADRLLVVAEPGEDELVPSPATVAAVRTETSLPLTAALKANEGWSTSGSELTRLTGAAYELAAAGAAEFVLGFLGPTLEVDVGATLALTDSLGGLAWSFGRAVDQTLDHDRAWAVMRDLHAGHGLHRFLTAGSTRGLQAGMDDLCMRAAAHPETAALAVAAGGLVPEQVPWLVQAGIRGFHLGRVARPGGSWRAYVDAAHVRAWRRLVDDEGARRGEAGVSPP